MRPLWFVSLLGVNVLAVHGTLGCGGSDASPRSDGGADAAFDAGALGPKGCDPMAPSYCAFPFPNDFWTRADENTPTGLRLDLPEVIMPQTRVTNIRSDPGAFNEADGFSPAIAAMTHMLGATITGLATPDSIESSLAADSPTVILNADTGERVAHWVDLDEYVIRAKERVDAMEERPSFLIDRPLNELEGERTLMLRPAIRLDDATRYIVAIRNVRDATDAMLPASPEFAALRDGETPSDEWVNARRGHYEAMFSALTTAGVERDKLQLVWDFTTASRENNTQWMVHMRDDALANSPDGVPFTIDVLTEDVEATTACRLEVDFDMPLYLTKGESGGLLNIGSNGMPEQNGTFSYKAVVTVPNSAKITPAPIVEFGHGQLGAKEQVLGFQEIAGALGFAMVALDFKGFASDDVVTILSVLSSGDLSDFRTVPERMHQGLLNFLIAMRTLSSAAKASGSNPLKDALANSCGGAMIDGEKRYYFGGSQGGIWGATLMALSTDVQRGILAVPGQPYNLLLNRSVNFDDFGAFFYRPYDWNAMDAQMNLALIQGLWDRAEPSGYSKYIRTNTLPGTPSHEVLIQVSKSDHQVTNLGAHIMARTIGGVVNLAPTFRSVWGIPEVSGMHTGTGMVEVDFGNIDAPITNIPPWADTGEDPHGRATELVPLGPMITQFLATGTVMNTCTPPACDADDLVAE